MVYSACVPSTVLKISPTDSEYVLIFLAGNLPSLGESIVVNALSNPRRVPMKSIL